MSIERFNNQRAEEFNISEIAYSTEQMYERTFDPTKVLDSSAQRIVNFLDDLDAKPGAGSNEPGPQTFAEYTTYLKLLQRPDLLGERYGRNSSILLFERSGNFDAPTISRAFIRAGWWRLSEGDKAPIPSDVGLAQKRGVIEQELIRNSKKATNVDWPMILRNITLLKSFGAYEGFPSIQLRADDRKLIRERFLTADILEATEIAALARIVEPGMELPGPHSSLTSLRKRWFEAVEAFHVLAPELSGRQLIKTGFHLSVLAADQVYLAEDGRLILKSGFSQKTTEDPIEPLPSRLKFHQ